MADGDSSFIAYTRGGGATEGLVHAYLAGGNTDLDDVAAFLSGDIFVEDSIPSYLTGEGSLVGAIWAWTYGVERSNLAGYLEGSITGDDSVANDYIVLETSDASVNKKFKVVAMDYDDGTPDKAGVAKRTLGGGVSYSVGAVYYSWRPTIRVRQVEGESGYGDLDDLLYFYELNNPVGVPSNLITFIDHHNVSRVVVMPGTFKKQVLTAEIEGSEAIYLVQLSLQEIPNA